MNNTRNIIFSFLGGVAVGALATIGILKKTGKLTPAATEIDHGAYFDDDTTSNIKPENITETTDCTSDKHSFVAPKTLNTSKIPYDGIITKPDLAEVSKKYQTASFDKEMAEREHPEEDSDDEEDEETALQNEIGEALMDHTGEAEEYETDGFGTVLCQLNSNRRDSLVYLVHVEHAGEIYPLEDLTYYAGDDVLCDVTDTPVDDLDRIVGDALSYFGQDGDGACGEGPDKLYVRNCTTGFEYEITRKTGYFGAHLYGAKDEEVEEAIHSGRKKRNSKKGIKDEEDE